jgi:site-specific recombinase XerC
VNSHIRPHKLCYSALEFNGDLRSIQELLGRTNLATARIYIYPGFQYLATVHDAVNSHAKKEGKS